MNTVMAGLNNGSLDYLGRREPIKKHGEDPLAKAIASKWGKLKTARKKTESLRWEACSFVQHRMNEFNNTNSPVKLVKLFNTMGIFSFDTIIKFYLGTLFYPPCIGGMEFEDVIAIYEPMLASGENIMRFYSIPIRTP